MLGLYPREEHRVDPKPPEKKLESVKIRPLSSVIFLYPSALAAIACGLWVQFAGATPADPGASGIVFTLLFFFNLSIVAFDYTRLTSVVIILLFVILGLLSAMYPAVGEIIRDTLKQPMFMNTTFYWIWALGLTVVLLGVVARTRWDYWEVKNNELLHHHGVLGDLERWPAPGMRISKEINDVMEFALCRSGRLVLVPPGEQRAIVIDNVPGINKVEAQMQTLLSTLRVDDNTK